VNWWTKVRDFFESVWKELKRVSWPTRKEVYGTTLVVVVTILIFAVYLGIVDLVLAFIQKNVLLRQA
jgi:preprotein translocase subunit SecE